MGSLFLCLVSSGVPRGFGGARRGAEKREERERERARRMQFVRLRRLVGEDEASLRSVERSLHKKATETVAFL